jgi:hypothetical protein
MVMMSVAGTKQTSPVAWRCLILGANLFYRVFTQPRLISDIGSGRGKAFGRHRPAMIDASECRWMDRGEALVIR